MFANSGKVQNDEPSTANRVLRLGPSKNNLAQLRMKTRGEKADTSPMMDTNHFGGEYSEGGAPAPAPASALDGT